MDGGLAQLCATPGHKCKQYLRGITVLRATHSFLTACRMQRGTAGSNSRDMLADRTSTYGMRFSGDSSVRCSRICTSLGLLDGKFRKAGRRGTKHKGTFSIT